MTKLTKKQWLKVIIVFVPHFFAVLFEIFGEDVCYPAASKMEDWVYS